MLQKSNAPVDKVINLTKESSNTVKIEVIFRKWYSYLNNDF